jgi:hypothetical protein
MTTSEALRLTDHHPTGVTMRVHALGDTDDLTAIWVEHAGPGVAVSLNILLDADGVDALAAHLNAIREQRDTWGM